MRARRRAAARRTPPAGWRARRSPSRRAGARARSWPSFRDESLADPAAAHVRRAALARLFVEADPAAALDGALDREAAGEVVAQVRREEPVPRVGGADRAQLSQGVDPDAAQVVGQRGAQALRVLERVLVGHQPRWWLTSSMLLPSGSST